MFIGISVMEFINRVFIGISVMEFINRVHFYINFLVEDFMIVFFDYVSIIIFPSFDSPFGIFELFSSRVLLVSLKALDYFKSDFPGFFGCMVNMSWAFRGILFHPISFCLSDCVAKQLSFDFQIFFHFSSANVIKGFLRFVTNLEVGGLVSLTLGY